MDFLIHLNSESNRPLRDQIYDGLRHAILDGELSTGARLPSSRVLATNLGVSRFTVTDAYNRLLSEGYVAGRHGSGTFVAPSVATVPIDQHPPLETQSAAGSGAGLVNLERPRPIDRRAIRSGSPAGDRLPARIARSLPLSTRGLAAIADSGRQKRRSRQPLLRASRWMARSCGSR